MFALHLLPMLMLQETAFHAMLQDSGTPIPLPALDVMPDLLPIPSTSDALAQPQLHTSIRTTDVLPVTLLQDGTPTLLPVSPAPTD